ncbi:hypothetical protein [Chlorogloeopsis fritschii]|uniref:hypothetical protein n=1 Tax=Chlorogloeopsis fritschii TaxID=1124 RepID=UPI0023F18BD5|nr:hypothetical protein [Chlorogloeopsis fritschii]
MTIAKRENINFYDETKHKLSLLVKQIFVFGLSLIVILLLIKDKLLAFSLILSYSLSILLIFWNQKQQQKKKESEKEITASHPKNSLTDVVLDINNLQNSEINQAKEFSLIQNSLQKILNQRADNQNFSSVTLILADLSNAQLAGINLDGVYLSGANW